jgi:hypothetical protein
MRETPQIPNPEVRANAPRSWVGSLVILGFLCLPNISSAATIASLSGKILGLVTDAAGTPQMGAVVLLLNRDYKACERGLTDEKGAFSFDGLAAGVYSIQVSLASFMPVSKSNIFVQPGLRTLLNVSLAGLFSSVQLVYPTSEQRAIMNDDWKWVLRTSSSTRPVLRLLPGWNADENGAERRASTGIFSDTRALVKVSAGDGGRVTSFGNESDLGTAFSLATSVLGRNQLQFSGNVAYARESGAPSAGFAASYSRNGQVSTPVVTVTMRQMYLPGRVTAALAGPDSSEPMLRTLSLSAMDATQITDSLRLEYGFALDAVSFSERLNLFSPYARLIYSLSDREQVEFSYTSGIPRSDMFLGVNPMDGEGELQNDISALALFPKISARNSHARIQQAQSFEAGYHRAAGSRSYDAAVFREGVSNAALMIAGAEGFPAWDVLPDLFTSSSVFNAGGYQSLGYMASVTQRLGDNLKVSLMYGSGGALVTERSQVVSESPDDLRSMIHHGHRRAVTSQVSGVSPWSGTQFTASYQWTDQQSVTPAHFYATQRMRADAGLNVTVRQPIPTFSMLPIRMEASADLRNLLAEGYMPFSLSDGRQIVLMHTPRSFRGGLSFIF